MGRRHFHFAPGLRALGESLDTALCVDESQPTTPGWPPHTAKRYVPSPTEGGLHEEPRAWTPGRRRFPHHDPASPHGATPTQSVGVRRTGPIRAMPASSVCKRHFGATELATTESTWNKEAVGCAAESPRGRRHVGPPPCHLGVGGAWQGDGEAARAGRRHVRASSDGATRRRDNGLPPQRRHMTPEDHLWGLGVCSAPTAAAGSTATPAQAAQAAPVAAAQSWNVGGRLAGGMASDGMAQALRSCDYTPESNASAAPHQRRTMSKGTNLVGGALRQPPPPPEARAPGSLSVAAREAAERERVVLGGAQARPASPAAPRDHLMAGTLRPGEEAPSVTMPVGVVYRVGRPEPPSHLVGASFRNPPCPPGPLPPEVGRATPRSGSPRRDRQAAGIFDRLSVGC
eukprot:TRINITY_DN25521_c0_g4_i1.p1 TRINITY_DN25521_c0_g4~~TRINITY_DN25521_c0_g4_i1.p1  ORF type:complete len:417 (+),score=58.81 TRINITY_DN25521_c0_g4_i1:50-1252(+)